MADELARGEEIVGVLDEMLKDVAGSYTWREAVILTSLKDLCRHVAKLQTRLEGIAETHHPWDGS